MLRKLVAVMSGVGLLLPAPLYASTSSGPLKVQVTIVPQVGCAVTATDMNFGTLTTVVGTETGTSTVSVHCQASTALFLLSFSTTQWLTNKSSVLTNPANNTIGFTMALGTIFVFGSTGTSTITGTLNATASPQTGVYKSVEIIDVIY